MVEGDEGEVKRLFEETKTNVDATQAKIDELHKVRVLLRTKFNLILII